MSLRVQQLREFHETKSFGTRADLIAREQEARALYKALGEDELHDVADVAISQTCAGNRRYERALLCLACFRPGSLQPFQGRLADERLFYPGVLYHGATADVLRRLIRFAEDDENGYRVLVALAWIGDEEVQSGFDGWRREPPWLMLQQDSRTRRTTS